MKSLLLAVVAVGEALTGLVLLVYPAVVAQLLFGAEISGAGSVMSRIAGIALTALGVACFPGAASRAHCAMLTYNALATLYLLCLGLTGGWTGKLLWPVIALHAILTLLLARSWSRARESTKCMSEKRTTGRQNNESDHH